MALGANTTANGNDSVALGQGSAANRPDSVSVGNAAAGMTRQITNVAPGTEPNDAVNLGQLNRGLNGAESYADTKANKVGAVAASMAGADAEVAAGKHQNTVALSMAEFNGQPGVSFAYQHRLGRRLSVLVSVASNDLANTAFTVSAGYSWR